MTTTFQFNNRRLCGYFVASLAFALIVGGCTQTAKNEYSDAGSHIEAAAKDTGAALKEDATHVKEAAQDALAKNELSSKIRKGMQDHPDLGIKDLSVDVSGSQVVLHGSIPSENLNQRAEHLARKLAGSGYTVDDQLSVSEGKS